MAVNNAIGLIQTSTGNGEERGFYTPTEVSRIARIPQWTLNHWRREGIIVPSVEWVDEQDKTHSGHSFPRDGRYYDSIIVGLLASEFRPALMWEREASMAASDWAYWNW